ncbi:hypothetical protein EYF80_010558 [Liparis tanakae]|uniref:Uncharacterized protein n=1 Tax=Liparis tanakae TaxID=230148 RepID=A0A4Z2IQ76_9TELE|nr:hypothetical protein EYF80_010558 [Liparis tanakae]
MLRGFEDEEDGEEESEEGWGGWRYKSRWEPFPGHSEAKGQQLGRGCRASAGLRRSETLWVSSCEPCCDVTRTLSSLCDGLSRNLKGNM